ncbi:MAG: DUF4080 domain-containing protein [Eisenbergiella sp.]
MRYQARSISVEGEAPYEVLSTRWLSYGEVLPKLVEEMVEVYYNSGQLCDDTGTGDAVLTLFPCMRPLDFL